MASRALVMMLAASALLLAVGVKARRDIPEVQGTRDAWTMDESDQPRTEGINAKIFEAALDEFQAQTHNIPNENVKARIAAALKEYHAEAHPQEDGDLKVESASVTPKRDTNFDAAAVLPDPKAGSQDCTSNNTGAAATPSPDATTPPGKKTCACNDGSVGTEIQFKEFSHCFCPHPKNGDGVEVPPTGCSTPTVGEFAAGGVGPAQLQPHF